MHLGLSLVYHFLYLLEFLLFLVLEHLSLHVALLKGVQLDLHGVQVHCLVGELSVDLQGLLQLHHLLRKHL